MDDNFLIQQTLNGNRNAFRFLVLRYQKPIFKILGAIIFDKSVVEEIAQETFLRAYKSLSSFDPALGASFSTWLFTIARNQAFNELNKRKSRKKYDDTYESVEAQVSSPERQLDTVQQNALVREAVAKLPQEFRTAVVLSCLEGHAISEIAQIEQCSVGTVKSRIFRGKQMLRHFLIPILGDSYAKNL